MYRVIFIPILPFFIIICIPLFLPACTTSSQQTQIESGSERNSGRIGTEIDDNKAITESSARLSDELRNSDQISTSLLIRVIRGLSDQSSDELRNIMKESARKNVYYIRDYKVEEHASVIGDLCDFNNDRSESTDIGLLTSLYERKQDAIAALEILGADCVGSNANDPFGGFPGFQGVDL